MLPVFPKTKQLSHTDKLEVADFIKRHPPYSDFNFVSLFSYDTQNLVRISQLNTNLVVQFQDYLTNQTFYSFIGTTQVDQTAKTLLNHSPYLKLVPETVIKLLNPALFSVIEDPDNHDYITLTSDLAHMIGNTWRGKKNFVHRFEKNHGNIANIVHLNLNLDTVKTTIKNVFQVWESGSHRDPIDTKNEFMAIDKLLTHSHHFDIQSLGVEIDHTLKGFIIYEHTYDSHAMIHFEKADPDYIGIFPYIKNKLAIHLMQNNITYINQEQDLGLVGLKNSKKSYHPHHFLKKYVVTNPVPVI